MSQPGTEYLRHILEEIDYLLAAVGKRECSEFLVDETLKRATARSLSIIGEAAKKVPSSSMNLCQCFAANKQIP